jgi:hypothetical protein
MLSSNSDFAPLQSSSAPAIGSVQPTTTASFNSQMSATTQTYTPFGSSWTAPIYDPPPPANMTWNMPTWMPSIDYSSRVASRPETYHYTAPSGPPVFAQNTSPYHPARELVPNADHYVLSSSYGHYNASHSQTPGVPSVSLPPSSSYCQGHYPGPH